MSVKTVRVLRGLLDRGPSKQLILKASISNGSESHCKGKCKYHPSHDECASCHLGEGHAGPCVCGSLWCRKKRLNDPSWMSGATFVKA
jgi:hypothetical protein